MLPHLIIPFLDKPNIGKTFCQKPQNQIATRIWDFDYEQSQKGLKLFLFVMNRQVQNKTNSMPFYLNQINPTHFLSWVTNYLWNLV